MAWKGAWERVFEPFEKIFKKLKKRVDIHTAPVI